MSQILAHSHEWCDLKLQTQADRVMFTSSSEDFWLQHIMFQNSMPIILIPETQVQGRQSARTLMQPSALFPIAESLTTYPNINFETQVARAMVDTNLSSTVTARELNQFASETVPILIDKVGDNNARVRESSSELLLYLASVKEVRTASVLSVCQIPIGANNGSGAPAISPCKPMKRFSKWVRRALGCQYVIVICGSSISLTPFWTQSDRTAYDVPIILLRLSRVEGLPQHY